MRNGFPHVRPGQTVGLLGGSFDPPHEGHVRITREALKLFSLDRVWWLVSPGNPLKTQRPAPMARRISAARAMMQDPRVTVTGLEARLGARLTADTIAALGSAYPGVRFVWLMGADNLVTFHLWQDWSFIFDAAPIGVFARPGDRVRAQMSPAARRYRRFRIGGQASHLLARAEPPAWCFVNVPMTSHSSTELRRAGAWQMRR